MTQPHHSIAVERTLPHGAILWPALRSSEETRGKPLCDPPIMRRNRKINIYKGVRRREPFPNRRQVTVAVNDPFVPAQDFAMARQVLLIRDLPAIFSFRTISSTSELDYVQRVKW